MIGKYSAVGIGHSELKNKKANLITVLGLTATGKTSFAANLSSIINGEIISADSRQVYKGMNLGTGKDYEDYVVDGNAIPCHLIDLVEPGSEYNVYQYQNDFIRAYKDIISRRKQAILCGGTGMYLEAVLNGYKLAKVPENAKLREELEKTSEEELVQMLSKYRNLHNTTDSVHRKRTIRAIEIAKYEEEHPELDWTFPEINAILLGINYERSIIRERITKRLKERMETGMVQEVELLLKKGVEPEKLKFYGLEYKFLTMYLLGELNHDEMVKLLNIAIHQFAKRQATWFRRMERNGFKINWIDGTLPLEDKLKTAMKIINKRVLKKHDDI